VIDELAYLKAIVERGLIGVLTFRYYIVCQHIFAALGRFEFEDIFCLTTN